MPIQGLDERIAAAKARQSGTAETTESPKVATDPPAHRRSKPSRSPVSVAGIP
jgi:hypothetical protein